MLLDLVPLLAHRPAQVIQVDLHLARHRRGLRLSHVGLAHLRDRQRAGRHGGGHARPPRELHRARLGVAVRAHALEHVRDVLADLVRRLEAEQVEVPQEVVVEREELQVELGQRQAPLARVRDGGHHVLVPQHVLVGVQRHLVDGLALRPPLLERAHHNLQQERGLRRPRVLWVHQPQLLRGQRVQLLGVQRAQVLRQNRALLHRRAVAQRQLAQLLHVLEAQPLELQQPVAVRGRHVLVRQRRPRVVADLEPVVEPEQVHQLAVQAPRGVRVQGHHAALDEELAVVQHGADEAARGELAQQVDDELHEALAELNRLPVHSLVGGGASIAAVTPTSTSSALTRATFSSLLRTLRSVSLRV